MKNIRLLLFGGVLLFCFSCDKTPDVPIESKLNEKLGTMTEMAELGTVEYTISKIVKCSDDAAFYKFGDRKILFSCHATMKAGIDLSDFNKDCVKLDDSKKSVTVTLPKPKILSYNIPIEGIKIEYEKIGAMRSNFTAKDRNLLLKQAEEDILADAPNLGILKDAEHNAKLFFEALFLQLGFENINVKYN